MNAPDAPATATTTLAEGEAATRRSQALQRPAARQGEADLDLIREGARAFSFRCAKRREPTPGVSLAQSSVVGDAIFLIGYGGEELCRYVITTNGLRFVEPG